MEPTYGGVLRRAVLTGLVAGVVLALYLVVVAEPTIDAAIALEGHGEDPLFSRGTQVGGGVLAAVLFAGLMAVVFGTVYAFVRHRVAGRSDFTRSLLLAAVGFGTTALMPMLKYPANPPGVGDPDTVNERTVQYGALVAFAVLAAVLLGKASGVLRRRLDDASRLVVLGVAAVVVYGVALVLFPSSPDTVPASMPAALLWRFRVQSLGSLALLWAVLGAGLGWSLARRTD